MNRITKYKVLGKEGAMFDEIIYIVGDKFERLSEISNVKTATQLKQAIAEKSIKR